MSSSQEIQTVEAADLEITSVKPQSRGEIIQLAAQVSQTQMVPKVFHGKPDETAVAMLWAYEAGVNPITALGFIGVINGKPGWYADAVPGIAKAKKLITGYREWMEGTPFQDDWTAYCEVHTPSGFTHTNSFSYAEAKKAGLSSKQGPWSQYPRRMLQWRARSWAIRDAAPDAFFGPTAEELQDAMVSHHGFDNAKVLNSPQGALDDFAAKHRPKPAEPPQELRVEPTEETKTAPPAKKKAAAKKAEPKTEKRKQDPGPDDSAPAWPEDADDGRDTSPCGPDDGQIDEEGEQETIHPEDEIDVWLNEETRAYKIQFGNLEALITKGMHKATSPAQVADLYNKNGEIIKLLDPDARARINDLMDERARILSD